jgi:hypothetical protein
MAGAKQLATLDFILVPAGGRMSSRDVLEALYCVAPWCLQRGATSEAGEEADPPGPRGTDGAKCQYRGEGGKRASVRYRSPPDRGLSLLL